MQKLPLAARAYAMLRDSAEAQRLSAWTVEDKAGAVVDRAFIRVSNAPLTQGIPGFYTRDGYLTVFLPGLHAAAAAVAREQWAYGSSGAAAGGGETEDAIAAQAVALYRGDFVAKWTELLNDLRIRKLVDLQQSILVLTALSGPDSVLMKLLNAIVHDTDLSPPAPDAKDAEALKMRALIASTAPAELTEQPFAALRAAMQSVNGGPSQIGDLMRTINELYEQVSRAGGSPQGVMNVTQTEGGLNDANQKLISQSRLVPPPVDIWLSDLSASVTSVTSGTARNVISQTWNSSGQRFCQQATRGRYPFAHGSGSEISVDDFTKLFGPGGTMDSFFNQNLREFVNTRRRPWRWQYNSAEGVSSAFLAQFEHADAIRQAFFSGGTASFHYEITPDRLDPNANAMTLDIGGQMLRYAHGPVRSSTMVWPAGGDGGARLSVEPSSPGGVLSRARHLGAVPPVRQRQRGIRRHRPLHRTIRAGLAQPVPAGEIRRRPEPLHPARHKSLPLPGRAMKIAQTVEGPAKAEPKVFCFFFAKKKCLLASPKPQQQGIRNWPNQDDKRA